MHVINKFSKLVLLFVSTSLLASCLPERKFQQIFYVSISPNQMHGIFEILDGDSSGWRYDNNLYFSNDLSAKDRFPEPRYKIPMGSEPEIGGGCIRIIWKTDFEATVKYCISRGSYPDTKRFKFNGHQIILHFEQSPKCDPSTVIWMKREFDTQEDFCRYYFPELDAQMEISSRIVSA